MKLREELAHIKTDVGSLRSFAWIVGGIFLAIGVFVFLKSKNAWNLFSLIGAVLLAFGLLRPQALKMVYISWMALGLIMGLVVSPIMFSVLYFTTITPIALIMRLSGKQFLDFRLDKKSRSYWNVKKLSENIRADAENQF